MKHHTPTPWEIGVSDDGEMAGHFGIWPAHDDSRPICFYAPPHNHNEEDDANAALICEAVNNYKALNAVVDAAREQLSFLEKFSRFELIAKAVKQLDEAQKRISGQTSAGEHELLQAIARDAEWAEEVIFFHDDKMGPANRERRTALKGRLEKLWAIQGRSAS